MLSPGGYEVHKLKQLLKPPIGLKAVIKVWIIDCYIFRMMDRVMAGPGLRGIDSGYDYIYVCSV